LVFTIGADELYQEPNSVLFPDTANQVEEVEENIALNTLGTIIHETLKSLYDPFVGRFISESDIQNCFKQIDDEVLKQFKVVYKEGEIKKGRNLLALARRKRL
jgi:hypothetical protein